MFEAVRRLAPLPPAKAGAAIRALTPGDLPAVTDLFARVYPEYRWISRTECETYFREMLFEHPWHDIGIPSWVAEERGRLSGCYAVMPRPMRFRGRPIRAAVGFQFMIDP